MRRPQGIPDWIALLRSAAGARPHRTERLGAGALDAPLLASLHRACPGVDSAPIRNRGTDDLPTGSTSPAAHGAAAVDTSGIEVLDIAPTVDSEMAPEVRIWWWVHRDDPVAMEMVLGGSVADGGRLSGPILPEFGRPITTGSPPSARARSTPLSTIEVWTDAELACLHALCHRAWRADGEAVRNRLELACEWHMEHTQPDNATNRPWAIPAFLVDGGVLGRMYAEMILHNASAQGDLQHPLTRAILHDAASLLERAAACGRRCD